MTDRAALEIEVTEEMILAGIEAMPYLASETLGNHSVEILVSRAYRAMRSCAPEGLPSRPAIAETSVYLRRRSVLPDAKRKLGITRMATIQITRKSIASVLLEDRPLSVLIA